MPPAGNPPGEAPGGRRFRPDWPRLLRRTVRVLAPPALACAAFWLLLGFQDCPHPLEGRDFSRMVLDRDGSLMRLTTTSDQKYRIRMPVSEVPGEALESILQYEDRWFWYHPGINPASVLRAGLSMLAGGRRLGGSTITMQVARLAYGLTTNTVKGKLRQMYLALLLERHFSKAEILEAYFNLAPYGGNVEGLAAAARIYFHKSPPQLSLAESEALMLVPQNPVRRRPSSTNKAFQEAARSYWHGKGEYAPLKVYSDKDLPFRAPHLTSELLSGEPASCPGKACSGGVVKTTIDRQRQQLLEEWLRRFASRGKSYGLSNAAALLVHWPTMEVRAISGSANFFDSSISGQVDGTRARRSPGSSLKPFIYALALEQGLIHPQTVLADTPKSFSGYDPENFDKTFRGPIPAHAALRASRNVPALTLANQLNNPDLYDFLRRAGVSFASTREHYGLSLVLGGAEVTMRELAGLYAMLANGGVWRPLRFVHDAGEQQGEALPLLSPEAAFVTLSMLEDEDYNRKVRTAGGRVLPARIKTGTSNGLRDAWTSGIIGPYVLVVWIGNFDNTPNPLLVGGMTAVPLWMDIARGLGALEPMKDSFAKPPRSLNLKKIEVCAATGDLDTSLCPSRTETWFIPGVSPVRDSGVFRKIDIVRETGQRACIAEEGRTESVVWEFWPTEFASMFAAAGRPKPPPPPFEAGCAQMQTAVRPPVITLPKRGLTYHASLRAGGVATITLRAESEIGQSALSWFADGEFIGKAAPGEVITWKAAPGRHHLVVADESQNAASRSVTVEQVP